MAPLTIVAIITRVGSHVIRRVYLFCDATVPKVDRHEHDRPTECLTAYVFFWARSLLKTHFTTTATTITTVITAADVIIAHYVRYSRDDIQIFFTMVVMHSLSVCSLVFVVGQAKKAPKQLTCCIKDTNQKSSMGPDIPEHIGEIACVYS